MRALLVGIGILLSLGAPAAAEDKMVVDMGRTGKLFHYEHAEIEPDIMIGSVLGRSRIELKEMPPRSAEARYCLGEYYSELARRFKQGFDVTRSRDPDAKDMHRPRGTFIVAMSDGLPIGCVGLKGSGVDIAEIKRLWVAPSARGLGLGRRLMGARSSNGHISTLCRTGT